MKIDEYFRRTWQVFFLAVFASVGFWGQVPYWMIVIPGLSSLISLTRLEFSLSKFRILWLSFLSLSAASTVLIQASSLPSFSAFASLAVVVLMAFSPITIFFRKDGRGYWYAFLNHCLLMLAALISDGGVLSYLIGAVVFLAVCFNLHSASIYFAVGEEERDKISVPSSYLFHFLKVFPIGVAVGIVFFYSFPRDKYFRTTLDLGELGSKTGYTGEVNLSGGRSIDNSEEVAFQIEGLPDSWISSKGSMLLFRGNALERFDGTQWHNDGWTKKPAVNFEDMRLSYGIEPGLYELNVFVEPTQRQQLFYPGVLHEVPRPSMKLSGVYFFENGDLHRGAVRHSRFHYKVKVAIPSKDVEEVYQSMDDYKGLLKSLNNKKEFDQRFGTGVIRRNLEIPSTISSKNYFSDWVRAVTLSQSTENSLGEFLRGLKRFYLRNYKASLLNDFSSADTFKSFLTEDKRGHCEYFATATVLLLRTMGIPARMALGYRGGEFNEFSELFEVRQKSAHAWVEVLIPQKGWMSFDPTPSNADPLLGERMLAQKITAAVSFWFNKYVVDYNRATQMELVQTVSNFGQPFTKKSPKWDAESKFPWLKTIVVIGGLVFFVGMLVVMRRSRDRIAQRKIPRFYKKFLRKLSKYGEEKLSHETYREFHLRLMANGWNHRVIMEFDALIERELYGKQKPVYREIRASLRALSQLSSPKTVLFKVSKPGDLAS